MLIHPARKEYKKYKLWFDKYLNPIEAEFKKYMRDHPYPSFADVSSNKKGVIKTHLNERKEYRKKLEMHIKEMFLDKSF